MNRETLIQAMGNQHISDEECAAFNAAMLAADCTTVDRAAMWCAQMGHESAGLQYYEEIADGSAYEGRADLGNTVPGFGRRYKGRGIVQCTGAANYRRFSEWCFTQKLIPYPLYLLDNPELVATQEFAHHTGSWYWTSERPMNDLSDRRDLEGATRAINGGLHGLPDRRDRYHRALMLGAALLPDDEGGFTVSDGQEVRIQMRGPGDKGWKQLGDKSVVDALADCRDQLGGPDHNWGGWDMLGNRTVVEALAVIGVGLKLPGFKLPPGEAKT